jgi:hypothetical protein
MDPKVDWARAVIRVTPARQQSSDKITRPQTRAQEGGTNIPLTTFQGGISNRDTKDGEY